MGDALEVEQRSYHFVGIGGVGMSALAYILVQQGHRVSGSDISLNARIQRLESLGVQFAQGHAATHVVGDPHVIYSSAIRPQNPELAHALDRGLPICHRSALLAQVFNTHFGIGVAGTHGKTTTSSMIGYLLLKAGLDPTLIIGGEVDAWGGNARLGKSCYLVAEVDESDGSLVQLFPRIGVITNIELDHPDHYVDLEQVIDIFCQYAGQCNELVASLDCPNVAAHLQPTLGYTIADHPQAVYRAKPITYLGTGTIAEVWEQDELLGTLQLQVLGSHNLSNALAAVAVGRRLGLDFAGIAAALAEFRGAHRRFEVIGEVAGVTFIDDYAHHPSEVEATLAAARLQGRRIIAVFQPHRPSRLTSLFLDFASAFKLADQVVLTPTYRAGETETTVTSSSLAQAIANQHPDVTYVSLLGELPQHLAQMLQPGDLVLFLGAGDLNQSIQATIEAYAQRLQEEEMKIAEVSVE